MKPKREGRHRRVTTVTERAQHIVRVMDEAFGAYERGLVALRKTVVASVKRRVLGLEGHAALSQRRDGPR